MNIEDFKTKYAALRDVDKIEVDLLCDHAGHEKNGKTIAKGPAKRNILKNGGSQFVCRACDMKFNNPMTKVGKGRQTNEEILVICPHPSHNGERGRTMKKSCYYGSNSEPYEQVCGSCAQKGKVMSEEQKNKISETMTGRSMTNETKEKISSYMKSNQEGIERGRRNLIPGFSGGWNKGMITPEEVRQKQSEALLGQKKSLEHRLNISIGRKKMLKLIGGFSTETREKISRAVIRQYKSGFEPQMFHLKGWHHSLKLNKQLPYKSSYEKKAFMLLDDDEAVKHYEYESLEVKYWNPEKKIHSIYLVDIKVEYTDGTVKYVEIKPAKWLLKGDPVLEAKFRNAEKVSQELNATFEVWTEVHLYGIEDTDKKVKEFTDWLKTNLILSDKK